jgi:hypothetical protein
MGSSKKDTVKKQGDKKGKKGKKGKKSKTDKKGASGETPVGDRDFDEPSRGDGGGGADRPPPQPQPGPPPLPFAPEAGQRDAKRDIQLAVLDLSARASGDSADGEGFNLEEGRAEKKQESSSCCHKMQVVLVLLSLYLFNLVAFLACGSIVVGQVAAYEKFDTQSPELVVLGTTIAALGVLSAMGIYATCRKRKTTLRMYSFMLLVLILMQCSIVWVLYSNIDSGFTDQFLTVMQSLCDARERAKAKMETVKSGLGLEEVGTDGSLGGELEVTTADGSNSWQAVRAFPGIQRTELCCPVRDH